VAINTYNPTHSPGTSGLVSVIFVNLLPKRQY